MTLPLFVCIYLAHDSGLSARVSRDWRGSCANVAVFNLEYAAQYH